MQDELSSSQSLSSYSQPGFPLLTTPSEFLICVLHVISQVKKKKQLKLKQLQFLETIPSFSGPCVAANCFATQFELYWCQVLQKMFHIYTCIQIHTHTYVYFQPRCPHFADSKALSQSNFLISSTPYNGNAEHITATFNIPVSTGILIYPESAENPTASLHQDLHWQNCSALPCAT